MFRVLFDDLYTLACHFHSPIFRLCVRKVLAERCEPRFRSLEHLANQIFGESQVVPADS